MDTENRKYAGRTRKKRTPNKVLVAALVIVCLFALFLLGVLAYEIISYRKIKDQPDIIIVGNAKYSEIVKGKEYTLVTFNIGYGIKDDGFSDYFAVDINGNQGERTRAESESKVRSNLEGIIATLKGINPDFILLQEVDTNSARSFNIDEDELISGRFPSTEHACLPSRFGFCPFPMAEMLGDVESGLSFISNVKSKASQVGLDFDSSVIKSENYGKDKYLQIIRCDIDNSDKQFVLINLQFATNDISGEVREKNLEQLEGLLYEEKIKGNYVIVGGDFNLVLTANAEDRVKEGGEEKPNSVYDLSTVFDGYTLLIGTPENPDLDDGTFRYMHSDYDKESTYTAITDGFLVSDDIIDCIEITVLNSHEYKYSYHNPVVLKFKLK